MYRASPRPPSSAPVLVPILGIINLFGVASGDQIVRDKKRGRGSKQHFYGSDEEAEKSLQSLLNPSVGSIARTAPKFLKASRYLTCYALRSFTKVLYL